MQSSSLTVRLKTAFATSADGSQNLISNGSDVYSFVNILLRSGEADEE